MNLLSLAVIDGMGIVRAAQLAPRSRRQAEVKADKSLLTVTDKKVERAMASRLGKIPGYRFKGEEGTETGSGQYTILVDPVDGTRPFVVGLCTSTVIAAVLDPDGLVIACVVGEPATGRVWSARSHTKTVLQIFDHDSWQIGKPRRVRVWKAPATSMSTIWLDAAHAFARDKGERPILNQAQITHFVGSLMAGAKLSMAGSNGLHLALVANGNEYAGGQVTTAVGGMWDIAPVLLVLQAGGCARGFSICDGALTEQNPLELGACDIMVTAHNAAFLEEICRWLEDAVKRHPRKGGF
jgi:fructose-1,6-bisphosphatase/inositol monophosphatase family enzyme